MAVGVLLAFRSRDIVAISECQSRHSDSAHYVNSGMANSDVPKCEPWKYVRFTLLISKYHYLLLTFLLRLPHVIACSMTLQTSAISQKSL